MSALKFVSLFYGIFLLIGAFFGFKAGSRVSIIAGLVSGGVVLICAFLADSNFLFAAQLLAVISALLAVIFFIRFMKTKKLMPSGMLLTVTLLVFVFSIFQIFKK